MFRPLGQFKKIQCPKIYECNLQNCIFSHDINEEVNGITRKAAYDPFSAGNPESPPLKKRKVEPTDADQNAQRVCLTSHESIVLSARPSQKANASYVLKDVNPLAKNALQPAKEVGKAATSSQPVSVKRPISPPSKRDSKLPVPEKIEKLIPRPVARAPAVLKVRMSLIELLHKQLHQLNLQSHGGASDPKAPLLNDQQLIKWVLDEEEQAAAKLSSDIYRNAMSQKVLQLKRLKPEDWSAFVSEKINQTTSKGKTADPASTGLSKEEEVQILKYLRTNLTGLDAHGYVTKPPTAGEIQKAKEAIKATGGYELCDRCGIRFQVFPGRDEQGRLTSKGECHYHWAKINRGQWQKTDHITGQAQASFPCCGQLLGSEGCTQAATHVFKVTDPKRLATLMQFEQTPARDDGVKRAPIAFDCEMAYTTYGMEMVRITAVSWPQNKEVLDVLVRPFGEILDLNTRFSGVTQEQYNNALPYSGPRKRKDDMSEEDADSEPLCKVESPAVAREMMFDLLTPETPLIGHAIDNDLNVCRIVHPFVVDTVLLFPHPRGLPIRFGLKHLASIYLNRSIQAGAEAGHDSKEDSIATGDLVKVKVTEKWQMMRLQGWNFHQGVLVPPTR